MREASGVFNLLVVSEYDTLCGIACSHSMLQVSRWSDAPLNSVEISRTLNLIVFPCYEL